MSRVEYHEFPGFESIYLEDSYVLDIRTNSCIEFEVEAALLQSHPLCTKPREGEQYCYRTLSIRFDNVREYSWVEKHMRPIDDPVFGVDYGNIDFFFLEDGRYHIGGEWGALVIVSDVPTVGTK
jgi:hypothetical protein